MGFLSHPGLRAETHYGGSGNYGLMDQQAALRWVRAKIAAVGGDADNITLFGESAGGRSVLAQLVSPTAAGLFDRAIVQSGVYARTRPLAAAESAGRLFAYRLGCPAQTPACPRGKSAAAVLDAQDGGFGQTYVGNIDRRLMVDTIEQSIADGDFHPVPVMNGVNHNEFSFFVALIFVFDPSMPPVNRWTYPVALWRLLAGIDSPQPVSRVWPAYPINDAAGYLDNLSRIGTDALLACPWSTVTRDLAAATPTYAYEFRDSDAPMMMLAPAGFDYGAAPTTELGYLFDYRDAGDRFTPAQRALAGAMRTA